MIMDLDRKVSIFGLYSFVILYFYYSFFFGIGIIPDFLGGYISLNAILILPFALIWFFKEALSKQNLFFQAFVLFLVSLIVSVFLNLILNYQASSLFIFDAIKTIMLSIVGYYIGANFHVKSFKTKNFLKLSCLSILILLILNIVFLQDLFANYKIFSTYVNGSFIGASYQQIGRTIMLACIMFYLISDNKNDAVGVIVLSIILMPLVGSRNYGVLLVIFFLLIFIKDLLRGKLLRSIALLIPFALIVFIYAFQYIYAVFGESRFSDLLILEESSSFLSRAYAYEKALELISDNPIFGVFGHSVTEAFYAHNILFIWGNYGFLSFLLIFFIVIERIYAFVDMSIKNFNKLYYTNEILIPIVLIPLVFLEAYLNTLFIPIVFGILHSIKR